MRKKLDNKLFVISAPSCGGKTTISKIVAKTDKNVKLSVSFCTRLPRSNESEGIDYFFVTKESFLKMKNNNEFIETAQVFGDFYGTSLRNIEKLISDGFDVILTIDTQGYRQIKNILSDKIVGIFLVPTSIDVIKERMLARGENSPEEMTVRLAEVEREVQTSKEYDHIVVNDILDTTVEEVLAIISSYRTA